MEEQEQEELEGWGWVRLTACGGGGGPGGGLEMPFLGAAVRRDGTGRTGVGGYWGGRGRRRRRRREEEEQEEGGGVQWSPLQKARAAGGGGEPERQQGAHSAAAGGGMGMVTVTAAASTQRGLGPGRLPAAAAGLPPAGRPAFLSRRPLRGWQDWRDGAGCWLDGWLLPSGPGPGVDAPRPPRQHRRRLRSSRVRSGLASVCPTADGGAG